MNQRYEAPSEYGGRGENYTTPDGAPRSLSAGERARLLRSEALNPGSPFDPSRRAPHDDATNPDPGSVQLAPGFRRG